MNDGAGSGPEERWEAELRAALGDWVQQESEPLHLSERELLKFVWGELEAFESERVRDHVVGCAACAREYQAIRAFAQGEPGDASGTLGGRRNWRPLGWTAAIAASVLLAVAAGYLARGTLQEQVVLNTPMLQLKPEGYVEQAGESPAVVAPADRQGLLHLILINPLTDEIAAAESLSVEILDGEGRAVYRGAGLEETPLGNFALTLYPGVLSAGQFRIVLKDARAGPALAEYRLFLE